MTGALLLDGRRGTTEFGPEGGATALDDGTEEVLTTSVVVAWIPSDPTVEVVVEVVATVVVETSVPGVVIEALD